MKSRFKDVMDSERGMKKFIPYSSHVSENTISTIDGDLIRIWRLEGLGFETMEADVASEKKDQLNTALRSLSSRHVAVWSHVVRRHKTDRLNAVFSDDFCRDFDNEYAETFSEYKMMGNEIYLSLVYRPTPTRASRAALRSERRKTQQVKEDMLHNIERLNEIAGNFEASLSDYNLTELGVYEKSGIEFSSALTFLNFLISGNWQEVRSARAPLSSYLGNAWLRVGVDTLELKTPKNNKFARCLEFTDYTSETEPGLLNGLLYEPYPLIITQSFSFLPFRQGKERLTRSRNQMQTAEEGAITQMEQIEEAIDGLVGGEFVMGEYHYTLMIFGDTEGEVKDNTSSAASVIEDQGFLAALSSTAMDAAFYAQLPANWSFRPRIAELTSKNFAGLSAFHNFKSGKRNGNPWGQAVTMFKTPSGQPLYFNLHSSKQDRNNFGEKVLGNTRVIGQSGTGKTVFLNVLLAQSQKFREDSKFSTVFFDKDQGAKLAILAVGGRYFSIKNGAETGFNPFQMKASEKNILFLNDLVRELVIDSGEKLKASEELAIDRAVRAVMAMDKSVRRLSTLIQNLPEPTEKSERENSLIRRLEKWCADNGSGRRGALAWALDSETDIINFTTHDNYGFDGTEMLENQNIRTPVSMYLLHRMEEIIDGRRFIYFMDEAWKWVDDDAFAEFAGNKQLTIRKQNGLGVFATQMPDSLLGSKIASALVQQVATEVYLPNPKADYREYTDGFKLTDTEFDIVKSLADDSRCFLIKQGSESFLGELDLAGMDDALSILSGSIENIELADSIIAEVGDKPSQWIPIFHQRRREAEEAALDFSQRRV